MDYYTYKYTEGGAEFRYPPIEETIQQFIEKGNAKINLIEFSRNFIEIYINEIAKTVPEWINRFLATRRVNLDNMSINIILSDYDKNRISDELIALHMRAERFMGKMHSSGLILNSLKEENSEELYCYIKSEAHDSEKIPGAVIKREVREFVVSVTFSIIRKVLFPNTPIFPTERSTFITLPFPSIQDKEKGYNIKKRNEHKYNGEFFFSEPVKDFLEILKSSLKEYFNRKVDERNNPKITEFIRLANLLERDILGGDIDFEQYGSDFEVTYKVSKDINLELNVSSSMVKELAPLALYLKYLAKHGDLLVIDEPEMNLHPSAQVEFAEFTAMLVNAGLNVLITTHSPYIVDHLGNLMQAAKSDDKEKIRELFYLERTDAFIDQDKISVYLFEDGTARNIVDETGVIDWRTFGNVSSDIANIYTQLI